MSLLSLFRRPKPVAAPPAPALVKTPVVKPYEPPRLSSEDRALLTEVIAALQPIQRKLGGLTNEVQDSYCVLSEDGMHGRLEGYLTQLRAAMEALNACQGTLVRMTPPEAPAAPSAQPHCETP